MSVIMMASAVDPRLGLLLNSMIDSATANGKKITDEFFKNILLRLQNFNYEVETYTQEIKNVQSYLRKKGFDELSIMEVLKYFHKGFTEDKKNFSDGEISLAIDAVKKVSDKLDTLNVKPAYGTPLFPNPEAYMEPPPPYTMDDYNKRQKAVAVKGGRNHNSTDTFVNKIIQINRKLKKKTRKKYNKRKTKKYNKRKTKKYINKKVKKA